MGVDSYVMNTGKSFVFPSLDFDPHSQGGMVYVNIVP